MQIDRTGETRARMLGVLLGIGEDAGVGLAIRLWRGALEISPDGDFSGNIADPETLGALIGAHGAGLVPGMTALQRVGFIETAPKLRVRGLDRYERTWRKNSKSHGTRREPGANPARKTETEIKTKTKRQKKLAPASPPPASSPEQINERRAYSDALCAEFKARRGVEYAFAGAKDGEALTWLQAKATQSEAVGRFGKGLDAGGFHRVSSIAELRAKWNHLTGDLAGKQDVRKGRVGVEHSYPPQPGKMQDQGFEF